MILILLSPGTLEAQATHIVSIFPYGRNPENFYHFMPPRLTIPAGDRVDWRISAKGWQGGHNIIWDDGIFPPAPTADEFTYSQTFDSPGTFRYRCSVHGRGGAIIVPIGINAGLSDAWWNPTTPGQGFFINVFPDSREVFLAWFTYDTERPDNSASTRIGEPGHRWLTAFGPYSDIQAVLDVEMTRGGVFNAANPAPTHQLDGTIILEFSDCNAGTVRYDIPSIGRQGVIPIQRLSRDNESACDALAGAASARGTVAIEPASMGSDDGGNTLTSTGGFINRGLNDAWVNPATPGQGFFISVLPGLEKMFLAWLTYDTTRPSGSVHSNLGDPGHRWLTAFGPYTGNQAVLDIEVTQGGLFDAATPEPSQLGGGGTVIVDMADCKNGTVTYDIESANLQGEIPIKRIALDNVPLCESLAGD